MVEPFEDFVINEPYGLTHDDINLIRKASPEANSDKDWEKSCLKDYKQRTKDYLRQKQNSRCAYCRVKIHEGECPSELDHIIEKSKRADWMYVPRNLCYSCKRCNTNKGHTHQIIRNYDLESYPNDSDSYLIINPYLDKYSDHIQLVDGILYKGITDKGRNTIEYCKLNRYDLACNRAEELINRDADNIMKLVMILTEEKHQNLIDNWNKFLEKVNLIDIIKRYRESHKE